MAEVPISFIGLGAGGGSLSSDVTATRDEVLEGVTAITSDSDNNPIEGTIERIPHEIIYVDAGANVFAAPGYYDRSLDIRGRSLSSQTPATATAEQILVGYTAWVNGARLNGSMHHLTDESTIQFSSVNERKVIEGAASFMQVNTDGVNRALIRYDGTGGYIASTTLIGMPVASMAQAGGLTAAKLMQGQTAFGISGTATSDATATALHILVGDTAYVKGVKVTGTMPFTRGITTTVDYTSTNTAKVVVMPNNDIHFQTNSDGVKRLMLQYRYADSYLQQWTLLGVAATLTGNAVASQVLSGSRFTSSNGLNITGTMANVPNGTNITLTATDLRKVVNQATVTESWLLDNTDGVRRMCIKLPTTGYYTNGTIVGILATRMGNATRGQVLSGRTFTSQDGLALSGTLTNRAGITGAVNCSLSGGFLYVRMLQGAYLTNASSSGYPEQSVTQASVASAIGLTANKLFKGQTVLGITGTAEGYVATPQDWYLRGQQVVAGFSRQYSSSAFQFLNDQIKWAGLSAGFSLYTIFSINSYTIANGITRLNIQGTATEIRNSYDSFSLYRNITDDYVSGNFLVSSGRVSAVGNFTVSFDVSNFHTTYTNLAIRVGRDLVSGSIYRVWLS